MQKDKKSKEWLEAEYIGKQRTANDIGRELKKDPKTIWTWLRSYEIPTRPRGFNTDHLVKDGSTWIGRKHSSQSKDKIRAARMKDGHVPYLKDGVHWLKGAGKEGHPMWKGGLTPERQALYASPEWADAVKAVWARDNATCQKCGIRHNTASSRGTFHIHHIVSFMVRELRSDVENLVLLCRDCHHWVHSKSNVSQQFIKEEK